MSEEAKLPRARVAHRMRGRIRLKLHETQRRPELMHRIRDHVSRMPGVRGAEINPLTGSILIQYDPNHREAGAADNFLGRLSNYSEESGLMRIVGTEDSEFDELARDAQLCAEYLASRSKAAEAIVEGVNRLNLALKLATDNDLDLNVATPLGLAAISIATVGLEAGTPLWVTLAISAFHSFVNLHPPERSPDQRTQPGHKTQQP